MIKSKKYFTDKEQWLKSKEYNVINVYDENFAIDFSMSTIKEKIDKNLEVQEPKFVDIPNFN
ncbi:hypothetical protein IO99_05225 [Clostridium sulfidigenes]|uniref:Uncharacterized protein n=1 Tax=Clostridium sulfidigenes TaxID=318464 RepID=A0A084JEU9_9CLOT|nr:hypothetical protein IO99_05225 [Clostridium sulfidigenes]